jgi:hypothetical protein
MAMKAARVTEIKADDAVRMCRRRGERCNSVTPSRTAVVWPPINERQLIWFIQLAVTMKAVAMMQGKDVKTIAKLKVAFAVTR